MGIHRIRMHHHDTASCLRVHGHPFHSWRHTGPGATEAVSQCSLVEGTKALEVCDLVEGKLDEV